VLLLFSGPLPADRTGSKAGCFSFPIFISEMNFAFDKTAGI
jgi:hypothetical protein